LPTNLSHKTIVLQYCIASRFSKKYSVLSLNQLTIISCSMFIF
jgi:hypothetical protein